MVVLDSLLEAAVVKDVAGNYVLPESEVFDEIIDSNSVMDSTENDSASDVGVGQTDSIDSDSESEV
jgi:hypothetical protein